MKNTRIMTALLCTAVCMAIAPAANAQNDGYGIETVTVTAQRKSERLIDVPISVGVVSGDAFRAANFSNLTDLQYIAPSVTYNTNFGGGFEIRGVGTQSVTSSIEQSVSVVIDDIVHGLPEIQFAGPSYQALTDIERIEVLRGPQGTLFGKNSAAGVLQVITKRPDLDAFSADGSISYGTANEQKMSGNINFPIDGNMALRASGYRYARDGYIKNLFTNKDIGGYENYGGRIKYLWQSTERLEFYLIASVQESEDTGNGIWTLRSCGSGFNGGLGNFSPCATTAPLGVVPGPENLQGAWDGLNGAKSDAKEISGRITYDLGFATLKSITAFQTVDINEDVEVDSSQRPILSINNTVFDERQLTQEVRLEGKAINDRLDFTVGAFYYHTDVKYLGIQAGTYNYLADNSPFRLTSGVGGPVPCCQTINNSETESFAVFGQASMNVAENIFAPDDKVVVTGGLRYTSDRNSLSIVTGDVAGICQFAFAFGSPCKPATLGNLTVARSITADNISGKGTIQYYVNPDVNVYFTYATGYKGPSISYPRGLALVDVKPETVESFEIGVKGNFFDNRLFLAADWFHSTYTDFQGQALYTDPLNPANRAYVTTNAGGLKTSGIEVEAEVRASEELSLTGGFTWAPTEFLSFGVPCNNLYKNPATAPGKCNFPNQGTVQFDAAGYPLTYAPEYTLTMGGTYTRPISDNEQIRISANYRWQSTTYTTVADPNSITPAYGVLGANIGIGAQDQSWTLSFFARNLLDEYFVTGIRGTSLDAGSAGPAGCDLNGTCPSTIGYANLPTIESSRTIGVKLDVRFD